VLESVRFGMHLVERQPEHVHEIAFEQAVVAQDLERRQASAVRETTPRYGAARPGRARRDASSSPSPRARSRAFARRVRMWSPARPRLERVDRLQVVLDGAGQQDELAVATD